MTALGVAGLCTALLGGLAATVPACAGPRLRTLSSPEAFEVPAHRRDGARLRRVVRDHFPVLAPHLFEVVRECPRARGLTRLRPGDSPYLVVSRRYPGPHVMHREVRDRLVFAAAFANARGGYRIAVGIARRNLREQARLWNWRLVERFARLLRSRPKAPLTDLARRACPNGEVANPNRFGCGSPHVTGSAVDVLLLDREGTPLVTFTREFFYPTRREYRRRFLTSGSPEARHARLLEEVMYSAGFVRYCREAWHFETGPSPLYRYWKAAGKPGRCFGAGRDGWDPRREPGEDRVGDLLAELPKI